MNRQPKIEHKKVVFFDYFATITFIYSVIAIAAIALCVASYYVYRFSTRADIIQLLQDKEPLAIVAAIFTLAFIIMFIVNFIFNCIKAN